MNASLVIHHLTSTSKSLVVFASYIFLQMNGPNSVIKLLSLSFWDIVIIIKGLSIFHFTPCYDSQPMQISYLFHIFPPPQSPPPTKVYVWQAKPLFDVTTALITPHREILSMLQLVPLESPTSRHSTRLSKEPGIFGFLVPL